MSQWSGRNDRWSWVAGDPRSEHIYSFNFATLSRSCWSNSFHGSRCSFNRLLPALYLRRHPGFDRQRHEWICCCKDLEATGRGEANWWITVKEVEECESRWYETSAVCHPQYGHYPMPRYGIILENAVDMLHSILPWCHAKKSLLWHFLDAPLPSEPGTVPRHADKIQPLLSHLLSICILGQFFPYPKCLHRWDNGRIQGQGKV